MEELDVAIKMKQVIAFCPAFLAIKRDVKLALFLSQIWYWSSRTKDKDGWFYKTQEDWEKELGIKSREQKRIRECLTSLGVLEEKLRGLPRKLYFRLNKSTLYELLKAKEDEAKESQRPQESCIDKTAYTVSAKEALQSCQNDRLSMTESAIQAPHKVSSRHDEKCDTSTTESAVSIYTEINTEITTENNSEIKKINKKDFVEQARPDTLIKDSVNKIFSHWKTMMSHPKAQLDDKRKALITKALKAGYDEQALCEAISGCAKTPHNMGDNDGCQRYDGLHIIFRNADQIDRFIANNDNPPRRLTQAQRRTQDNVRAAQSWLAEETEDGVFDGF